MKDNYFDTVAKEWNTPERKHSGEELKEIILNKISGHKALPEVKALEIGAGSGTLAMLLSQHFNKIDCVDSSTGMRDEFLKNKKEFSADNVFIYDESFLDNTDMKYDLMAPDGKFYLMDFCMIPAEFHKDFPDFDGHNGFSKEEIYSYFKNTGWKVSEYEIIKHGEKDGMEYDIFLAVGEME